MQRWCETPNHLREGSSHACLRRRSSLPEIRLCGPTGDPRRVGLAPFQLARIPAMAWPGSSDGVGPIWVESGTYDKKFRWEEYLWAFIGDQTTNEENDLPAARGPPNLCGGFAMHGRGKRPGVDVVLDETEFSFRHAEVVPQLLQHIAAYADSQIGAPRDLRRDLLDQACLFAGLHRGCVPIQQRKLIRMNGEDVGYAPDAAEYLRGLAGNLRLAMYEIRLAFHHGHLEDCTDEGGCALTNNCGYAAARLLLIGVGSDLPVHLDLAGKLIVSPRWNGRRRDLYTDPLQSV